MDVATFQQNFPPGVAIPDRLLKLLDFENRRPAARGSIMECYSGSFRITEWKYGYDAWFGDQESARQFVVFGENADGSLYALWLYPGRTVADAPVVFLGSEGTDCGLLSTDIDEFLGLLAIGANELGFDVSWGEVREANKPAPRLAEFRLWLKQSFGILPSTDPMAVIASARGRHPDFGAWIALGEDEVTKHYAEPAATADPAKLSRGSTPSGRTASVRGAPGR